MLALGFLVEFSEVVQPGGNIHGVQWLETVSTHTCYVAAFPPVYLYSTDLCGFSIYNLRNSLIPPWLIVVYTNEANPQSLFGCVLVIVTSFAWGLYSQINEHVQMVEKKNSSCLGKPPFFPPQSVIAAADFIRNYSVLPATSLRNVLLYFMLHF